MGGGCHGYPNWGMDIFRRMKIIIPVMNCRTLVSQGLAWLAGLSFLSAAPEVPDNCYLFSYFTGNGEDGLHLAWSADGLKWNALKEGKSFLTPKVGKSKLMRDPCIVRGPDGVFHMVWTDSWDSATIGCASSKDLITWSEQKAVPVMENEPTVRNCWAPEIVYDAKGKHYLIFWASTIPGRFPEPGQGGKDEKDHRIYATTTKDFETFTPTRLFFDPGFSCIDSTLFDFDGKVVMFFKDERKFPKPMKNLCIATASTPSGPYKVAETPVKPPGSWVEGPTALKVGDEVILYFDVYMEKHYGALKSRDLKTWTDVTSGLSMPGGIRHGTAFEVSRDVLRELLKQ